MEGPDLETFVKSATKVKLEPGEKLLINLGGDVECNQLKAFQKMLVEFFGTGNVIVVAGSDMTITKVASTEDQGDANGKTQ